MSKYKIFEKYDKLEKIGEGAFAKVYRGQNKMTKEIVAIKEIEIKKIEGMDYRADTQKEIKFMQIYNFCPNSVKLYDVYDENEIIFLVIELCDKDLSKCLQKSKNGFTIPEVKIIMKQFNNILYEIRKRDMVHNDVKLENVLIKFKKDSKEFEIKLCDFGQMKLLSSEKDLSNNEWGIQPYISDRKDILMTFEKIDLLNLGIDMYRMLFKEAYKTIKEMLDRIDNNINDKDLKDLMHKILVDVEDVGTKLISWDEYFNHDFFKIDKVDFDEVENIAL